MELVGHDAVVTLDLGNYELLWPTSLFVAEGERILRSPNGRWKQQASWLMTEALSGPAVTDFEELPNRIPGQDPWGGDPWANTTSTRSGPGSVDPRAWFSELVNRAAELRHAVAPQPYWPQRRSNGRAQRGSTRQDARQAFARIIKEFADRGYLVEAFGEECVDDLNQMPDASEVIDRRLGIPNLWPLAPETWDKDTFYGLIEVFHDLLSRPRRRHYHDFNSCGWHHCEFHNGPARVLYRWKINELLREAGIEYELAAEGEDLGRLTAVTDDARSTLVHRALNGSDPDTTPRVSHAIALFRRRNASFEEKRSAVKALADILESRRDLLKKHLDKPDERALYDVANNYDLRHHNAKQRVDYDEAFLDWIFWWYLATVELSNQLLSSRSTTSQG